MITVSQIWHILLGFLIIPVTLSLFHFGIMLFYPEPKYPFIEGINSELATISKSLSDLENEKQSITERQQPVILLKIETKDGIFSWNAIQEKQDKVLQEQISTIDEKINELTNKEISLKNELKAHMSQWKESMEREQEKREFRYFLIYILGGLFLLLLGFLFGKKELYLRYGFFPAGLICLSIGFYYYVGPYPNVVKFLLLLLALLLLIYAGYRYQRQRDIF